MGGGALDGIARRGATRARMATSVNAIDEELAALERALATLSSDEEADGGAASASKSRERRKKSKKSKKEKRARRRSSSSEAPDVLVGGEDLPRIEPLPRELLPEGNDYKGKGTSFLGKRGSGQPTASAAASGGTTTAGAPRNELERRLAMRNDRPRCEVCQMDFTSDAQFEEHKRGKKHLAKARAVSGGGGGGGRGAGDAGGGRRYVKPPAGPHCDMCRKIFTSEAQKAEHYGGKWHKARERGELPPSNRPFS